MLLAVALALLLVQGLSAVLIYRSQQDRRETAFLHNAALRLYGELRDVESGRSGHGPDLRMIPPLPRGSRSSFRIERSTESPVLEGDVRIGHAEEELREILAGQDIQTAAAIVVYRPLVRDPVIWPRFAKRAERLGKSPSTYARLVVIAAVQQPGSREWVMTRIVVPPGEPALLVTIVAQTMLIYAVLVGAIALILGRLTRPLAALTRRVEHFASTRDADGQIEPQGPDDLRRLITAHNAMEGRIAALLDEKDVMLGAIGHDLKTPLAALRVRIESVEDDSERAKMAATIEDITRSLDDILSLARVGRPSDPLEPAELSALVMQVAEEFEDLGEAVVFEPAERVVLPLRPTWVRRALRNLVSNALRYGRAARIELMRAEGAAMIRIDDDGPGIPDHDIARMQEPFTRGDPSRNSATGGAGLGLTLARAIAQQHDGSLELANRRNEAGDIAGLRVTLRLPLT
ncbi:MAG: two-component sensor histidine kinase [Novosphingobium sp.]|nr:two-component sensor histidine kinase [Novosphingobium sp.]